jgi:hypothetical protein
MRLTLIIDPGRLRAWQAALADELRARGHQVRISHCPRGPAWPPSVALLISLERLVYRCPAAPVPAGALAMSPDDGDGTDLTLDLSFGAAGPIQGRVIRPVWNGAISEEHLLGALIAGRPLVCGVQDSAAPHVPWQVPVATEDRRVVARGLDQTGGRAAVMLLSATDAIAAGGAVSGDWVAALPGEDWPAGRGLAALAGHFSRRLSSLLTKPERWFVGWRESAQGSISATLAMPEGGWRVLRDDGVRFFADPFVAGTPDRRFLFCEELPFATGKAIISVVEIGPDGSAQAPRAVLETPNHLSYPFVFEDGGAWYMLPEQSGGMTLTLYKAAAFPDRWEPVAELLSGVSVSDATIVKRAGRYWMTGTVSRFGASTWDALHLWQAPAPEGPWTHVSRDPVLIDARSARPGGAFFERNGELWRPAQNCAGDYGDALALCRVTQLDEAGFAQDVAVSLRGGPGWKVNGMHTFNWCAGVEAIDGRSAFPPV